MTTNNQTRGFTLVELAIVVLIIALLIGAIAIGSNIIAVSRLTSVVSDVNRYKNAANMFRDKYHYLPGDIPTANTIWANTADGDGDGFIGGATGSPVIIPSANEHLQAWQHLALAGMIEGAYDASTGTLNPGENIPQSRYKNAGYTLSYSAPQSTSGTVYQGTYGHIIVFGGIILNSPNVGVPSNQPALKSVDAWNIDQKIDDGMPTTGNVMSYNYGNCVNNSVSPVIYRYSDAASTSNLATCALIFVTGF